MKSGKQLKVYKFSVSKKLNFFQNFGFSFFWKSPIFSRAKKHKFFSKNFSGGAYRSVTSTMTECRKEQIELN